MIRGDYVYITMEGKSGIPPTTINASKYLEFKADVVLNIGVRGAVFGSVTQQHFKTFTRLFDSLVESGATSFTGTFYMYDRGLLVYKIPINVEKTLNLFESRQQWNVGDEIILYTYKDDMSRIEELIFVLG